MAAAQANAANHLTILHDRIATTKNDEPRCVDDAMNQWRIIFDVLVPFMRWYTTRYRRMRFILRDLKRD